jgi:hypothetical protein
LAGIVGAVLAVPLVAVAWGVIKVWTGRDEFSEVDPVDRAQEQIQAVNEARERELERDREARKESKTAKKTAEAVVSDDTSSEDK